MTVSHTRISIRHAIVVRVWHRWRNHAHERRRRMHHVVRCIEVIAHWWRTQRSMPCWSMVSVAHWRTLLPMLRSTVIVLVIPPAWRPLKPSTVLLSLPAAAASSSVAVGAVAIAGDVASAIIGTTTTDRRWPPASTSSVVTCFATATAVGVRHESTVLLLLVVASSTVVVAPVTRCVCRWLLGGSGGTPLPAAVRPVDRRRRYHGSS